MAKRRPTGKHTRIAKPSRARPVLRAKLWVDVGGRPALTDAGADLLEQIAVCESVSEAARRLRFSYRRAWMLVDAMNRRWPDPLTTKSVGGKRGGGTKLTPLGALALRGYRDVQVRLEHFLEEASRDMVGSIQSA